jgi:hypothetical protein
VTVRGLGTPAQTALQQPHVGWFPLVKMEFDTGTVYLSGTDFNVDYDGQLWVAARGIGHIDKLIETPDQVEGLRFTLSGVPDSALADAQLTAYQGRKVTVMMALLDGAVLSVDPTAWQGRLDVPTIQMGRGTSTITVTAESRMADWQRPRSRFFNDADQRLIDPADSFFFGIEAMENAEIIIFSRESQMK